MDTIVEGSASMANGAAEPRLRYSTHTEKRQLVAETLVPGVSVSRVASSHVIVTNF
jgi:transposase-like protein